MRVVLVDRDGAAWSALIDAPKVWREVEVPLADLKPSRWAMLPQAFPGTWSYWSQGSSGARFDVSKIERLQFSLRQEDGTVSEGVEIERATID